MASLSTAAAKFHSAKDQIESGSQQQGLRLLADGLEEFARGLNQELHEIKETLTRVAGRIAEPGR